MAEFYDGRGQLAEVENLLRMLQQLLVFGTGDGIGFAIKSTLDIARHALDMCPVQPGEAVEIAERYDCDNGEWSHAQHLFEPGPQSRAVVTAIDIDERGHVATIKFDRETWFDDARIQHKTDADRRHCWSSLPVRYLRRVNDG